MLKPIRYTGRAREDLLQIWLAVAKEAPLAADRLYERLEARATLLERFPEIGRARPDIGPDARMLVEGAYILLYRVCPDHIQIVRVLHGARNIRTHLFEEGE